MLQAVMETLVKSGMRFNIWKNRNKSGLRNSNVLLRPNASVQPTYEETSQIEF